MHIETIKITFEFASGEDYSQYCQAVSASARIALSKETEERKKPSGEKWQEEAGRNYETVNGLIKMDNESICVVRHKIQMTNACCYQYNHVFLDSQMNNSKKRNSVMLLIQQ